MTYYDKPGGHIAKAIDEQILKDMEEAAKEKEKAAMKIFNWEPGKEPIPEGAFPKSVVIESNAGNEFQKNYYYQKIMERLSEQAVMAVDKAILGGDSTVISKVEVGPEGITIQDYTAEEIYLSPPKFTKFVKENEMDEALIDEGVAMLGEAFRSLTCRRELGSDGVIVRLWCVSFILNGEEITTEGCTQAIIALRVAFNARKEMETP